MLFNSIEFLIFFPIVSIAFFVIPRKLRTFFLLVASYYFYMSWNPYYAILILTSTVITYLSGLALDYFSKNETLSAKKLSSYKIGIVSASLIINLGILVVFKYANFILENVYSLVDMFGLSMEHRMLDLLLPVGISFYTFQALSYTLDVYHEKVSAEKNFINYALFVSFFPQLVAGPIERTGNLLSQIQKINTDSHFSYENMRRGLLLMFWGLFEKIVIADRAAILVDTVFDNYTAHGFGSLVVATIAFTFQIYCDFDGYTNIARGAANVIGIRLIKNFRQPYFAGSIRDFWKRWHISLTTWFTDYLYIPLGGSRCKRSRHLLNILIVFAISGLWHGANWNFVVWGMLHGLYQCIEILLSKGEKPSKRHPIFTFILVAFAWIFFRAKNVAMAFGIIATMFTHPGIFALAHMGLNAVNIVILIEALIILLLVDYVHEKQLSVFDWVFAQNIVVRWIIYLGLIWSCILLGIYGIDYSVSQFIYFQF